MGKTLLFLLLMSVKLTFGQFSDNFNDGNFSTNPPWLGQTSQFSINSAKQLKSSLSPVAQTISLSTVSALALNVKWEFALQLHFDPSTTNLARIYLIADQADLKGNLNGYFIQIGESGSSDSYDLYKQTGNSVSKIIDGLPKNRANINFLSTKLRVTRDDFGKWEIYSSVDEGLNYVLEGSVTDKTFTHTNWFGVYCKYTATRSEGFVFDDFLVEEVIADVSPPYLLSVKVVENFVLEATFSEAIAPSSLVAKAYSLKELNRNPTSVESTSFAHVIRLRFDQHFGSGHYTLLANGIADIKGNTSQNSEASTFYIEPYHAIKGDVVINEIFADPSPPVALPSAEFVELWNTTGKYILLKGWKYKDLTTTFTFSADTIAPNSYVILCAVADEQHFKKYGKTIGLSSWPTLNNDKDRLSLVSPQQIVIDDVFYGEHWYQDEVKMKGGFSLELIDPHNKCVGVQNWQASIHPDGGTPGFKNSVYQVQLNSIVPKVLSGSVIDETTVKILFNKSIDSLSAATIANYTFNNGIGKPLTVIPEFPYFQSVILKLDKPMPKGQEFVLTVDQLSDCAGNLIDPKSNTVSLFIAKNIGKDDILISEVLINPKSGGVEFVEIYNTTTDVLDLATLKLGNIDSNGNVANLKTITTKTTYIPSKAFWVLTREMENVKAHYEVENPMNFTKMSSFPSYVNEKGTVILATDQMLIDRFDYHENIHFPLLKQVKGISLERVSFQHPTNEKGNFKSAAQAVGFATPTYKNSQDRGTLIGDKLWLSTDVFSPDGDGLDDILRIGYQFADQDYVGSATIYTDKGIAVKSIFRNATLPKEGYFIWDGLNDRGVLCSIGIYIIKFEIFALNGKKKRFEKVCVLGGRLN